MVRTVREAVLGGLLTLLPRLHDKRLSKKQQEDLAIAVTVAAHVLLEIPADNLVPVGSRAAMAAALSEQVTTVSAMDTSEAGFQPWELYNAADLWNDAAGAITAAEPTFESTLNPF